jgi:hypothetical protein
MMFQYFGEFTSWNNSKFRTWQCSRQKHAVAHSKPKRQPEWTPKGARNRATLAVEALLDREAEALTPKVIELAFSGQHVRNSTLLRTVTAATT